MVETNWSTQSLDWNISWTYQIFSGAGAVRPPAKCQSLCYIYFIRYIHTFTVNMAFDMEIVKLSTPYGENNSSDHTQN